MHDVVLCVLARCSVGLRVDRRGASVSRLALGVLLAGSPGTTVPSWLQAALAEGLAGVCLFSENVPDMVTARRLTDELHSYGPRVVVAVDEEGGDVGRLCGGQGSGMPSHAALGVLDDEELTRRLAGALGEVLRVAGIDLDLAPCLDVASEPLNPVIGTRSFGTTPDLVTRQGIAYARGLAEAGVACCGKHYPGHGATRVDSHLSLPVLDIDEATLDRRELAPFRGVIGEGALQAVMTGHLVVPVRGPEAASLSDWSARSLREYGLTGPVVTDALGMAAIADRHGLGVACVRALQAGADLLCLDAPHQRDAQAALTEAVAAIDDALATGLLDAAALNASAARNATLSRHTAAGPVSAAAPDPQLPAGNTAEDTLAREAEEKLSRLHALGADVADRSLRTVGDVRLSGPPLLFDIRQRAPFSEGRPWGVFGEAVRRTWVAAELVVPLDPAEVRAALDVAPVGHEVVVLTRQACSVPPEGDLLAAVLAERPDAVIVHTGVLDAAPTAAARFPVTRMVCCHGNGTVAAEAVARRLGSVTAGGGG